MYALPSAPVVEAVSAPVAAPVRVSEPQTPAVSAPEPQSTTRTALDIREVPEKHIFFLEVFGENAYNLDILSKKYHFLSGDVFSILRC